MCTGKADCDDEEASNNVQNHFIMNGFFVFSLV